MHPSNEEFSLQRAVVQRPGVGTLAAAIIVYMNSTQIIDPLGSCSFHVIRANLLSTGERMRGW